MTKDTKDPFEPGQGEPGRAEPIVHRQTVIKGKQVRLTQPRHIDVLEIGGSEEDQQDLVRPLLDNGEVVGLIYHCSCGRQTRILFEYE